MRWKKMAWDCWVYCDEKVESVDDIPHGASCPEVYKWTAAEIEDRGMRTVTVPGYYASRVDRMDFIGPFEKLGVAKNVALYLEGPSE